MVTEEVWANASELSHSIRSVSKDEELVLQRVLLALTMHITTSLIPRKLRENNYRSDIELLLVKFGFD